MVVVLNPVFHSFSGRLGNLVYYHYRRTQYARRYVIPSNPDTAAQRDRRELFASAVELWQKLPCYKKDQWNTKACRSRISGYNLFISRQLRQNETIISSESNAICVVSMCVTASLSVSPVTVTAGSCDSSGGSAECCLMIT